MSDAEIKFSESLVILQHVESGLWITYQAQDNVKIGKQLRRAIVHPEGKIYSEIHSTWLICEI